MIQVIVIENDIIFTNAKGKKKIFQCPDCKSYNHFYTFECGHCRICHKELPNVYAIMINEYYRIKWHAGEHR